MLLNGQVRSFQLLVTYSMPKGGVGNVLNINNNSSKKTVIA